MQCNLFETHVSITRSHIYRSPSNICVLIRKATKLESCVRNHLTFIRKEPNKSEAAGGVGMNSSAKCMMSSHPALVTLHDASPKFECVGEFENVASVVRGDGGAARDHEVAGWANWPRRQEQRGRRRRLLPGWRRGRAHSGTSRAYLARGVPSFKLPQSAA
jgi:hypothetical protein